MLRWLVWGLHFDNHHSRIEKSYRMQFILNFDIYLQLAGGVEFSYIVFLYVGFST